MNKKTYLEIAALVLFGALFVLFSHIVAENKTLEFQLRACTQHSQHLNHSVAIDQTTFVTYNIDGEKNLRLFLDNVQPDKNYLILTYSVKRRNELINEVLTLAPDYPGALENASFTSTMLENADAKLPSNKDETKPESHHILSVVLHSKAYKKAPAVRNL